MEEWIGEAQMIFKAVIILLCMILYIVVDTCYHTFVQNLFCDFV